MTHAGTDHAPSGLHKPLRLRSTAGLRVVVAEDDCEMRRIIATVLERDGCHVTQVADGRGLLIHVIGTEDQATQAEYDLIVSDMRMPVSSGMQILKALRRAGREVPFILLSAFGDDAMRAEAEALGAVFVAKPFDLNVLRAAVHRLFAD